MAIPTPITRHLILGLFLCLKPPAAQCLVWFPNPLAAGSEKVEKARFRRFLLPYDFFKVRLGPCLPSAHPFNALNV